MTLKWWAGLLLLFSLRAAAAPWALHDLSILFPLPSERDLPALLGTDSRGVRGALLPADVQTELPLLVVGQDREDLFRDKLKVVAVRLDPCFVEGTGPLPCQRQIRLVWQPVVVSQGRASTWDAALHSFHLLSEAEWDLLLKDWESLRTGEPDEPLSVHPRLRSEGPAGVFASRLKEILLLHCGEENLIRVTAMTVNPPGTVWVFTGFERRGEGWVRLPIPGLRHRGQGFFADLGSLEEFRSNINPAPPEASLWLSFLADSRAAAAGPAEELQQVLRRAEELENPALHNPGTVDCVSCHVAQSVRLWGEKNRADWTSLWDSVRFKSSHNLANLSIRPFGINRLRAFGYFGSNPLISQRVIHETAAAAEALSISAGSRARTSVAPPESAPEESGPNPRAPLRLPW